MFRFCVHHRLLPWLVRALAVLVFVSVFHICALQAAPQRKNEIVNNNSNDDENAGSVNSDLPSDLNQANLRIAALDTLYELDLSLDQLRYLHEQAVGAGSSKSRSSSASDPKFAMILKHFEAALLDGSNDQTIARLRAEVVAQADSIEGLDDEIEPTNAAMSRSPDICHRLRASQVAAFLASHADEVSDPAERMVEAVEEIRSASATDGAAIAQKISLEVGRMVAGLDPAKSRAVGERVFQWLKGPTATKDELTELQRTMLQTSAAQLVGDVSNMDVLNHWLESEMALLLSNPQLPKAIEVLGTARQHAQSKAEPD